MYYSTNTIRSLPDVPIGMHSLYYVKGAVLSFRFYQVISVTCRRILAIHGYIHI